MNTFLKGAVVISTAVIGVGIADAAIAGSFKKVSETIDFTGYWPSRVNYLYGDLGHGLTYTVKAGYHNGGADENVPFPNPRFAQLTTSGVGLGVDNDGWRNNDSNQLDGNGRNEFIKIEFSQEVTLKQLYLHARQGRREDGSDEFDAGIDYVDLHINDTFDTDRIRNFDHIGSNIYEVDFEDGVDFAGDGTNKLFPATGTVFHFYTDDYNDDYRLSGLNIWAKIKKEVPEPAMTLGLLGVGAAMFASRRKRESA